MSRDRLGGLAPSVVFAIFATLNINVCYSNDDD